MANNLIDQRLGLTQGMPNQGDPSRITRYPIMQPNQMEAINQQLQSGLQNVNRNPSFDPYANTARQQLQEYGLPSIYQRINALGASQGPAAGMMAAKATSDLEGQLAMGRSQFDQGQQQFGLQQLGLGLTPQYHTHVDPKQSNFLQMLLPVLAQFAGGYMAGGGMGGIENIIKQLLSGMGGQQDFSQPSSGGFNIQNLMGSMGSNAPYFFGDKSGSNMQNLFQGIKG